MAIFVFVNEMSDFPGVTILQMFYPNSAIVLKCNCQPVASVYIEISHNYLGETISSVGMIILFSMKALYIFVLKTYIYNSHPIH